jgi:pimeloyl-ACP methyl ester carboxylesterase
VLSESDVELADGRVLHVYDTGPAGADGLAVLWHHGTPQVGAPPEPMLPMGRRHGMRWVGFDRAGYPPSTPKPGRDVAAVAADAAAVADALGIGRFAVVGASGGGPHALACAALLGDRVRAVVILASLAPFDADGLDWFAGMAAAGEAELRAATRGRAALEEYLASAEYDPEVFTPADHAAFAGEWGWIWQSAGQAISNGIGGMVDDDLAVVAPWGFDPRTIGAPILVVHGDEDRMVPFGHGRWLARHCPTAELLPSPGDGHISVHGRSEEALAWLAER